MNNASSRPLFATAGTLPNVFDGIRDWMQNMEFGKVTRVMQENGMAKETTTPIKTQGFIQPLQFRDLLLKPEGQRAWSWYDLYADPSLILEVDDLVMWNGKQTRVMMRKNWTQEGFVNYHLVQDWDISVNPS